MPAEFFVLNSSINSELAWLQQYSLVRLGFLAWLWTQALQQDALCLPKRF
jgi:hypothetical protein